MENLSGIAAFVHAAEMQSYVAAARVSGVSPSAIGKAIGRLENRLSVRLFNRTTRSVRLTEEGAVFYERCKHIMEELREAEAAMLQSRERPAGRLRISVPHIVGHHLLMPLLRGFTKRFPEIELDVDFDDRIVDLVTEGTDIAIRSGDLSDSGLIARLLGQQHFVVCGGPEYLDRHGAPETPDHLVQFSCIHFKYPSSGRIAPWAFLPPHERLLLPRTLVFNNTDAGLWAAIDGLGLAHLPVYVAAPAIKAGTLRPVLTKFMAPFGTLSLVWPSNRQISPKVRAFVDFIIEQWRATPGVFEAAIS